HHALMFWANLCICGGFNFLNSMLALMAIFIGAGYVVGFWLLILNENQRAN
ncbi:hypothetical protein PNI0008_01659, partial [Streptococcus pneumoniae PNI0008]